MLGRIFPGPYLDRLLKEHELERLGGDQRGSNDVDDAETHCGPKSTSLLAGGEHLALEPENSDSKEDGRECGENRLATMVENVRAVNPIEEERPQEPFEETDQEEKACGEVHLCADLLGQQDIRVDMEAHPPRQPARWLGWSFGLGRLQEQADWRLAWAAGGPSGRDAFFVHRSSPDGFS